MSIAGRKRTKFWCFSCDRALVSVGKKCTACGLKPILSRDRRRRKTLDRLEIEDELFELNSDKTSTIFLGKFQRI